MGNHDSGATINYSPERLYLLVLLLKTEQNKIKAAKKRIADANKKIAAALKGDTKSAYENKVGSDVKLFDKQMEYLEELIGQCSDTKKRVVLNDKNIAEQFAKQIEGR
jgi:uncharacterized protein YukE